MTGDVMTVTTVTVTAEKMITVTEATVAMEVIVGGVGGAGEGSRCAADLHTEGRVGICSPYPKHDVFLTAVRIIIHLVHV